MTKKQRFIFIFIISLATFVMSLNLSGLTPASVTLMKKWQVSASNIQWLTTIFMLTMAIVMPVSSWLFNNIPFKKLFASLMLLFIAGTILLILAPDFVLALLGRVLQASALGVLFPLYQTALMVITPIYKRGVIMGLAGLIMSFAIAAGSFCSSLLLNCFSWQELLLIYLILIIACLISGLFGIKNITKMKGDRLDYLSVLLSLGFAGLLYLISSLKNGNLAWPQWLLLVLSILLIAAFLHRQRRPKVPLLEISCLTNPNFNICLLLSGIAYSSLIMVTTVFPSYYSAVIKISLGQSGFALLWPAILLALINPVVGYLADRWGFKPIMLAGMVIVSAAYFLLALRARQLNLSSLIILTSIIEGGTGLVMMPATTYGISVLNRDLMASGTAIITTVRQLMGSLSTSIIALLLTNLAASGEYIKIFYLFGIANLIIFILAIFLKEED